MRAAAEASFAARLAWHQIVATSPLRFLCSCAPPYSDDDTFMTLS
jgi:hypothetical protein